MKKPLAAFVVLLAATPWLAWAGGAKTLLVEPFDGNGPKLGTSWESYIDDNKLGTKINPFALVKDGSPKGSKGHGHFSGHMGKHKAPYSWAVLDLAFNDDGPKDVSAYKFLRFQAKGDGKKYRVRLGRQAVEDYCDFEYTFIAPKEWTVISAPLAEFAQPSWGKQVAKGFKDVTKVGFLALAPGDDEDFTLRFTDIEFIPDGAPAAEKK